MDTHDTASIARVNTKSISADTIYRATLFAVSKPNKKLRAARIAAGFSSASAFAEKYGFTDSTYRSHENGSRPLTMRAAKQYGGRLGKPWQSFFPEGELPQDDDELAESPEIEGDGIVEEWQRHSDGVGLVVFPEYDVRASAGGGFIVERETVRGEWPFPRSYVERELRVPTRNLVILEVVGDSMRPTLESGDRVLVNMSDCRVSQPGIFVLWDGDGTVVKRLEMVPGTDPPKLRRISDNPLHGTYEVLAADTKIIGRAVWYGRRM